MTRVKIQLSIQVLQEISQSICPILPEPIVGSIFDQVLSMPNLDSRLSIGVFDAVS